MLCNGVEGGEDSERTMLPEYGMKMLFKNCHPRYGRKGYIYVLNRDEFVHAMGSQWVAYKEQIPENRKFKNRKFLQKCFTISDKSAII